MAEGPRVAIIYGSPTDHDTMAQAGAMLERFGVDYEETFISPHRSPRTLQDWIAEIEARDVDVVIAGGGGATASLPGIIASLVSMPVIGVPLRSGSLMGLDALTAMTEMSTGVPVAVVGLGNAKNAAVLAVQILAVSDPQLRAQLSQFKEAFEAAAAGR